uniref:Uncharacterized protein n=1 Tax=viral metagenome TaxID=1070528 RepID=A0A6C0ATU6_9ZZZZ
MSSTDSVNNVLDVATPVVDTTPVVKVKKPRQPTLPAKFAKFLQFGVFLFNQMKDSPDQELTQDELKLLRIFDSVSEQQAFVQLFFDGAKDISKNLRKLVVLNKKKLAKELRLASGELPKKRTRKPKVSVDQDSSTDANTNADADAEPLSKKPRAKRVSKDKDSTSTEPSTESSTNIKKKKNSKSVQNTQDVLINELVSLARSSTPVLPPSPPSTPKESIPKESKPKKVSKPKKEPKESKPKKESKPNKEPKVNDSNSNSLPHQQPDQPLDDELEEDVRSILVDGQPFLLSLNDNKSLFHPTLHHHIGFLIDNKFSPI